MRKLNTYPLESDFDNMDIPQKALSAEAQKRILALAVQKTGTGKTVPHHSKPVRGLFIAAAVVCALAVTAFAAPLILQMVSGKISFFDAAPSQSAVDNPLDAPRGDYSQTASLLESYNAAVNLSCESSGVTVTLDNITMDGACMDAFFTLTGEQAVKGALNAEDFLPEWSRIDAYAPHFYDTTVNGKTAEYDCNNFYREDDSTLKLWIHYLLPSVPEGDTVSISMCETKAMKLDGSWRFDVQLDGAAVRAGSKAADAGVYFKAPSLPLNLTVLTVGARGGVIGAKIPMNGNDAEGRSADSVFIKDNTGKEIFVTRNSALPYGGGADYTLYYNLSAPDASATSLTLIPVNYTDSAPEMRTATTDEMKNGVKIETSPLGGYTVSDYAVSNGVITMQLTPYGWTGGICPEITPNDEGLINYATDEATVLGDSDHAAETVTAYHSALRSNTYNPQTGVYTLRFDYYAATDEQLNSIAAWRYYYNGSYTLDTENAATLALNAVN